MEREVGGGIGMGNTCKPMAVSFQCMTKFTTNKTNKQTKKTPPPQKKQQKKEGRSYATYKSLWGKGEKRKSNKPESRII